MEKDKLKQDLIELDQLKAQLFIRNNEDAIHGVESFDNESILTKEQN